VEKEVVSRLLGAAPSKPFDFILISGHEYTVYDPEHCRFRGDSSIMLWYPSGDVELLDLGLVERIRIADTLPFDEFKRIAK
jgi:hypothetical protein